ncbi:MAG: ATP-dependent Clp protease adapter ClpS [Bacteriovoracaceae bacterium]|nr:ATP-dependent Clp protease adapter ClpS [Bacteriovoracaceae bacterium]
MSADHEEEGKSGIAVARKVKVERPRLWQVLLHNDDYTTMEFVVHVLQRYFAKTRHEAQAIMLEVHTRGFGVCGIYTYEVAESKKEKVMRYARENGHPLKCSIEPSED